MKAQFTTGRQYAVTMLKLLLLGLIIFGSGNQSMARIKAKSYTGLTNGSLHSLIIDSYMSYDLKGKTYFYRSARADMPTNGPQFQDCVKYFDITFGIYGAKRTADTINADMCIIVDFAITDKSYTTTVSTPVYGTSQYGVMTNGTGYINTARSVTGYTHHQQNVSMFYKCANLYAYDNKNSEHPLIWQTSSVYIYDRSRGGSETDLRTAMPFMAFAAWGYLGRSSEGEKRLDVLDNSLVFSLWKEGKLANENITALPKYTSESNSLYFGIILVERLENETIVTLEKTWMPDSYSISPYTYIKVGGWKHQLSGIEDSSNQGYVPGTVIKKESGVRRFRLHFPVDTRNVDSFDLVEYADEQNTKIAKSWIGVTKETRR